jgi:hypothetical protein
MIAIVSVGLCAAVAVGCSARALILLDQARAVSSAKDRLQLERHSSLVTLLRNRFDLLQNWFGSCISRVTGSDRRRVDRRMLVLLESITRRLRSGSSLRTAVIAASADSPEPIDHLFAESLIDGTPFADALDTWMTNAAPSRVLAGSALRLAADGGGAVATVLDGVAESLRDRVSLDREVAALASQARASAMVLLLAPIGFAMLMAGVDARVARFQFGSPIGWLCCVIGITLDGLGAFWMSRMIGRVR